MRTIGIISLCFTLVVGCSGASPEGSANDNPANDAGPSLDAGSNPFGDNDSGAPMTDGAPSADGGPGCGSTDDPDDEGADSNCDGADGKVGFDVYVSPTGLDTSEGTPTSPKATIRSALEKARITGGSVLLAAGEYSPEALEGTLGSGTWRIIGGYDKSFKGKVNRERTTLKVPATGWSIAGTGTEGTLQHLQIVAESPSSDEHGSAYALRADVQRLHLDDVFIGSGNARDGKNGEPGDKGEGGSPPHDENGSITPKPAVCKGVVQPDWTTGSYTVNAEGLPAGDRTKKSGGSPGSDGAPGRDGDNAPKSPSLVDGLLVWTNGTSGLSDGKPGYGGAGAAPKMWYSTYLNASGGGGGCPGQGGSGATSGGGSIAIVLVGGELKITRSAIETGIAGSGGDGGAGGAGGPGARGGYPPDATKDCTKSLFDLATDCSAFGGRGGAGGAGGRGGGGAGGWTIGIVKVGTAKTDIDTATTFKLGAPGAGGLGKNGGYAPNGDRVREYAIEK